MSKNRFYVCVGDVIEDFDGNVYDILDERKSINQNSHTVATNMDYLCRDKGRGKERWVRDSTMIIMHNEGKLEKLC